MKIFAAVGSRGRPNLINQATLNWLPYIGIPWKVFVEQQDGEEYSALMPSDYLEIIPENNIGQQGNLSAQAIHAKYNNYELVWKLDDDIKGFQPRNKVPVEATIDLIKLSLDYWLEAFKKYPDLAAIGFPYQHQMFESKRWVGSDMRLQTSYICRPEWLETPKRVTHWEDFYRTMKIKAAGKRTLRYGLLGIDCHPVGKTPGGLQLFDAKKSTQQCAEYLLELWPGLKFKTVENKPWDIEPDFRNLTL